MSIIVTRPSIRSEILLYSIHDKSSFEGRKHGIRHVVNLELRDVPIVLIVSADLSHRACLYCSEKRKLLVEFAAVNYCKEPNFQPLRRKWLQGDIMENHWIRKRTCSALSVWKFSKIPSLFLADTRK